LGCLVVGVAASLLSFVLTQVVWRYQVLSQIKTRKNRKV